MSDTTKAAATREQDMPIMSDAMIEAGIAKYDAEDQEALRWLVAWARESLDGSRERLCDRIKTDWTTISRILRGVYAASIEPFLQKVRTLREAVESHGSGTFVHTTVTRKIHEWIDYACAGDAESGKIIVILGRSRRGKTEAAREWHFGHHGASTYVDCPATGGQLALLREIARKTGLGANKNVTKLVPMLMRSFSRRRVLILDEVARLIPTCRATKPRAMEFVRRLHDENKCPVVMIMTPQTWVDINTGQLRLYFEQLIGRCEVFEIPEAVRNDEVAAFCNSACNGCAPADLIAEAAKSASEKGKLERLTEDLEKAGKLAARRGEKLSARHVAIARRYRHDRGVWPKDLDAGQVLEVAA